MSVGCPFITCAIKRKGVEFCWDCDEAEGCQRWAAHRAHGRSYDTFVCYATLEANIETIKRSGLERFIQEQDERETLLREMLGEFNEGRSKTYFCLAASLLKPLDLRDALDLARKGAQPLELRERSRRLHGILDALALKQGISLKLRKYH